METKTYETAEDAYSEEPSSGSGLFLKFSAGESARLRIMGLPVKYERVWDGVPKTRWAWPVIVYAKQGDTIIRRVAILAGGATIYRQIRDLVKNEEDWGDPTTYFITVKRTGEGLQTEWTVQPGKKTPVHKDDLAVLAASDIPDYAALEALIRKGASSATDDHPAPVHDPDDPFADE